MTVTGRGGTGADFNWGVAVNGANGQPALIAVTDGALTVNGTGGFGTGVENDGVAVLNGGSIQALGSGSVSVTGVGGSGTGTNRGVALYFAFGDFPPGAIRANAGTVTIDGTGGTNPIAGGGDNHGVSLVGGGTVTATGDVIVNGEGVDGAAGLRIEDGSTIEAGGDTTPASITVNLTDSPLTTSVGAATRPHLSAGTVTVNGEVAPGASPGELVVDGDFVLGSGDTLTIETDGPTPGTDYDQVIVEGTVTLGGAALNVIQSAVYDPTAGTEFVIIDNDGTADPVVGTFAGLPEGFVFAAGGVLYQISYVGGDGNDVVLTAYVVPTSLIVDTTDDENDGNYAPGDLSLREAVFLANLDPDANTITFEPTVLTGETITLTLGEIPITEDVTITGLGAGQLTVGGKDATRHFTIAEDTTVGLSGLTLADGNSTGSGSTPGGSVSNLGTLSVTDLTFRDNVSNTDAGAIYSRGGDLTVAGSTFSNNRSGFDGGAIQLGAGALSVSDSVLAGNTAGNDGGAIVTLPGTILTITRSSFTGNAAAGDKSFGGAIQSSGTTTVSDSTLSGNSAQFGGAIDTTFDGDPDHRQHNALRELCRRHRRGGQQ